MVNIPTIVIGDHWGIAYGIVIPTLLRIDKPICHEILIRAQTGTQCHDQSLLPSGNDCCIAIWKMAAEIASFPIKKNCDFPVRYSNICKRLPESSSIMANYLPEVSVC